MEHAGLVHILRNKGIKKKNLNEEDDINDKVIPEHSLNSELGNHSNALKMFSSDLIYIIVI